MPDLELSIRQFKMSRSSTNWLPWFKFWISGTSKVGNFCGLVNVSPPIFFKVIILLVDQWFITCTVVRSGDFRVSSKTGLLFDPELPLFIKPTIVEF